MGFGSLAMASMLADQGIAIADMISRLDRAISRPRSKV